MKYGPTRVSRIAYELDMPVETCRYYLKRFHNAGFRFLPVVDYKALGLQRCILFMRFNRRLDSAKRENFLRWFDMVYTVYRTTLNNELEYYVENSPPQGEVGVLEKILTMLMEVGVLDNFTLARVIDGYYKPEWIKMYDFTMDRWGEEIDVQIPKLPYYYRDDKTDFDLIDLIIMSKLESDPTVKMYKISEILGMSPQLVSYHREKHIEGRRLIIGYVPIRRVKHEDLKIYLSYHGINHIESMRYLHQSYNLGGNNLLRFHTPTTYNINASGPLFEVSPIGVKLFTLPREHFSTTGWTGCKMFIEELEKIIKVVS
jgi:DNA-binding Lrp family transcriptional regulator